MFKKTLTILCISCLLLSAGCSKTDAQNNRISQTTGVKDLFTSETASEGQNGSGQSGTDATTSDTRPSSPYSFPQGKDGIDIDLTTLSANMVYAQVYDMVCYPDNYIGKTVKMEGQFAFYHDEEKDKYYFACIIADATACCSQGLEFSPEDKSITIDDFPESGTVISVTGTFNTYKEGDKTYCVIENAKFN